ncbi:MAG: hypothetical protein U0869_03355 [Chloroflexota bacterium]
MTDPNTSSSARPASGSEIGSEALEVLLARVLDVAVERGRPRHGDAGLGYVAFHEAASTAPASGRGEVERDDVVHLLPSALTCSGANAWLDARHVLRARHRGDGGGRGSLGLQGRRRARR